MSRNRPGQTLTVAGALLRTICLASAQALSQNKDDRVRWGLCGRHTIGTQSKRESPSPDSPVSLTDCRLATYAIGTAGFEPETP